MTGFILGIFSSLAATVLTLGAGWLGSKRSRHWAVRVLSKLTALGIQRSYSHQKSANVDLSADLAKARWVKVLAGRGNELTRDSFQMVWRESDTRLESVQVLLPDPGKRSSSFLEVREAEMRRFDAGITPGLLSRQVRSNIDYILTMASEHRNIELRLFDFQNICRIIITDQVAYFTVYPAADHGRNGPCLVFSHPGVLYDFALRMFAVTWSRATSAVKG